MILIKIVGQKTNVILTLYVVNIKHDYIAAISLNFTLKTFQDLNSIYGLTALMRVLHFFLKQREGVIIHNFNYLLSF